MLFNQALILEFVLIYLDIFNVIEGIFYASVQFYAVYDC